MQRLIPGLAVLMTLVIGYYDGYAQRVTVLSPAPDDFSNFGYSVSISGDYAIVGSPYYDYLGGKQLAGIADIYHRNGSAWEHQKSLTPSDLDVAGYFGYSVSISGDYAVVGVPYDDNVKGNNAGAAYVFQRSGTNWIQVKKLLASDGATNDGFGWSVGISGTQVVIGAPFDSNAKGEFAGAAYVFGKSGSNWPQQKKLIAGDGEGYDEFGYSVSISGNYAVIGSPYEDGKGQAAGAFYLFNKGASGWTQVLKRTVGDGAPYDHLGQAVAINGDYLAVGSPGDDTAKGEDAGSLYLFRRNGNSLVQEAKKVAQDGAAYNNLGYSVAIAGNYAIAGAPYTSDGGRTYIYKRAIVNSVPQWQQHRIVNNHIGEAEEWFGASVGITTNYAIVGVPGSGEYNEGRAEVENYLAPPQPAPDAEDVDRTTEQHIEKLASGTAELPASFVLHGNYPNPFNPSTTIRFDLPETADVTLEVVNLAGQLVLRRAYGGLSAGANRSIEVDGSFLPSGTYLYRLTAVSSGKPTSVTGRMVLVK